MGKKKNQCRMPKGAIIVTKQDLEYYLTDSIERKPSAKQLSNFREWVASDIGEWLNDNIKSFRQHLREKKEEKEYRRSITRIRKEVKKRGL